MDLRSDLPYPLLKHGLIHSYPSLDRNIKTSVAIIGAGISGALTAWHLTKAGFDVTVVDRRHVGMGSTAVSTALIQYELDTPLAKLIKKYGSKKASAAYLLCRDAIYKLGSICKESGDEDLFIKRPSLQFASFKSHIPELRHEVELRNRIGIDVEWLDTPAIEKKFGFKKPGAIFSKDGAELDVYKLTHSLLINSRAAVYDHTLVTDIIHKKKSVQLITDKKFTIECRWLVIAAGYESQQYIPARIQDLSSTYVILSERMKEKFFWYKNALIWETAMPYLYLRTTNDNRIIIGGKDIESSNSVKRDALLLKKSKELESSFKKLFPQIDFKTDFRWAGSFGSTADGLPYIGSIPQRPNTFFSIGLGGNGISSSLIAAELITDSLLGKKPAYAAIFSFQR
jgi:glycine/D-amino acid oxidase-like deaminating enzyme